MVLRDVVVAVIIQAVAGVLQIFDVPVPLVQRIVDHVLILQLHAHAQKDEGRHEQGVRPGLLRKIIVGGDRMLQHMVAESESIVPDIIHLAHQDIPVTLFPRGLIQRDQAVPHGAGIYRPHLGQSQFDQLVHPVLQKLQIFFLSRFLISLADSVIGHAARPVPGQIHVHGLMYDPVDHVFDLFFVIFQLQHTSSCPPSPLRKKKAPFHGKNYNAAPLF